MSGSIIVIDVPGLDQSHLSKMPNLASMADKGRQGEVRVEAPALTLPVHAAMTSGLSLSQHGIIGNGWYERDRNEVFFWPQSEKLQQGEKIWDKAHPYYQGSRSFKCFMWPGMASSADSYINVRPVYFADGRKKSGVYSNSPAALERIIKSCGEFPLHRFWGPGVSIESTRWIAQACASEIRERKPRLSFVYLPHLDYHAQTLGPGHQQIGNEASALDAVLAEFFAATASEQPTFVVMSGYQMNAVSGPIWLNRILRKSGHLEVVENEAGELIDFARSSAFAIADHQVAHVYVNRNKCDEVKQRLLAADVGEVLGRVEQESRKLWHPRSGEFLVLAKPDRWFAYPYWLDESKAPDFAQTVAIHAKPGYDPCEMLFDERLRFPKLSVAKRLLLKRCGFRSLMDVVSLDATRIRGSHGVAPAAGAPRATWICSSATGGFGDVWRVADLPGVIATLSGS